MWERLLDSLTLDMRRRKKSLLAFVPFIIAMVWVILLFISPLTQASGTIYLGNQGKVSLPDNAHNITVEVQNPVARAVYLIGDIMCHQHADRSFFIDGNQMPFCARCTGIFLGLAFGFLIGALYDIRMGPLLYFIMIIPLGLDGTLQLITPYESTNFIRIVTGMLTGTFSALVFAYIFSDYSS